MGRKMQKVTEQNFQITKQVSSIKVFSNGVFKKNGLFQKKKIPTTEMFNEVH